MMNKRILQDGFRNPYLEALQGLNVGGSLLPMAMVQLEIS
ncbi:hypothetical protein PVE_R1G3845 [Pseudomonas veronii 1YdBTEX2]|jgi:hypothetical protein|uniref:Uncharacterized protein n=1 Tax=Pseudomonas veronii 1YdBTEX2 TaxID=1295141 RepID=A0A1D3K085_PSEVE|nr:hypothetical protein C8K66_109109 [Pseudomonas sp. GV105]SBW81727.1 hypothetical protein PVE_R1G3845 [Pseudomonas veronii 1YdBTEX2]